MKAALALLFVAIAVASGGCLGSERRAGDLPAIFTPNTDPVVPSATATPRVSVLGVRVEPLRRGADERLREGVVFTYYGACGNCDGPFPPPYRVWREGDRVVREPVFGFLRDAQYPYTYAVDVQRGHYYAAVCVRGSCGGPFQELSTDAENEVYESTDHGRTWSRVASLTHGGRFLGFLGDRAVVQGWGPTGDYTFYPTGEPLRLPGEASHFAWSDFHQLVFVDIEERRLNENGRPPRRELPNEVDGRPIFLRAERPRGGDVVLFSWAPDHPDATERPLLAVRDANGRVSRVFDMSEVLRLEVAFVGPDGSAWGIMNDTYPAHLARIDLQEGVVHVISEGRTGLGEYEAPWIVAIAPRR